MKTINTQRGAIARRLFALKNTANASRQGWIADLSANAKIAKTGKQPERRAMTERTGSEIRRRKKEG